MIGTYDPSTFEIFVTERAETHFSNYVKSNDAFAVRLSLEPSGCAGFAYTWDIVKDRFQVPLSDKIIELENCTFVISNQCLPYLVNSTVDLVDKGVQGQMILVESPQATASCGCGESVSFG